MWLSNTATTAMMYPIGLSLLSALGKAGKPDGKAFDVRTYAPALLILCAYSSSLGGIGTPVGSPPNLIGLGMIDSALGIQISFVKWMILVFPISIIVFCRSKSARAISGSAQLS
jgi:sodium-dependent dicarboxylate transporter 2/3/5